MNADELAAIRRRLDAATPGPWRGAGDKVRATAADALIEDNILVAYYTGHDHRLGLETTGVAADIDLIANAPADPRRTARRCREAQRGPRVPPQLGRPRRRHPRRPRPVGAARSNCWG